MPASSAPTSPVSTPSSFAQRVPDTMTVVNLAIGGFAGLALWEIWANVPTTLLVGGPLEPPELIRALFNNLFNVDLPLVWARALHYATGVIGYPLGYFILTRYIRSLGMPLDGWIWGVITYFIALGFFAPLAGVTFLLLYDLNGAKLSFMSLVGHAIYGWLAAYVFENFERLRATH
jgi:hypothetical protein